MPNYLWGLCLTVMVRCWTNLNYGFKEVEEKIHGNLMILVILTLMESSGYILDVVVLDKVEKKERDEGIEEE